MKRYKVYDGIAGHEAEIMWLTDSQVVQYRRNGYYVMEAS